MVTGARMGPGGKAGNAPISLLLAGPIIVLAIASLAIGPAPIAPWTAAKALFADLGSASVIVREIRLPRTLLAILIGGTLGLIGAALQGLLRNPLADASVFGAPQAAAFGAVVVLTMLASGAFDPRLIWDAHPDDGPEVAADALIDDGHPA